MTKLRKEEAREEQTKRTKRDKNRGREMLGAWGDRDHC